MSRKRASPLDNDSDTQAAPKRVRNKRIPAYKSSPTGPSFSSTEIMRAAPSPYHSSIETTRVVTGPNKHNTPAFDTEIKAQDIKEVFYSFRPDLLERQIPDSKEPNIKFPTSTSSFYSSRRYQGRVSEENYQVDDPSIYSGSSSGEENETSNLDREDISNFLTREKARRLATAVKVPENSNMSEEEKELYRSLALRGITPVMSFTWSLDFSTLPESLFAVPDNSDHQEDILPFHTHRGTDFAAIRAFRELLEVGGFVRDCRLLTLKPQVVIQRSIKKYIRWAIRDACLRVTAKALPVHVIYTQKEGQTALSAVHRLSNKMEYLGKRHQELYTETYPAKVSSGARRLSRRGRSEEPEVEPIKYWPTLVGFLICGPILTVVSLDTNPESIIWGKKDTESRVKYLGQFDMSEKDQDVWNSLAIAMTVINMRRTMSRLADAYVGPFVPRIRHDEDDTDDEDM